MKNLRNSLVILVAFLLYVSPALAQLADTGIVPTDPGTNRINWAAASRGSTISGGSVTSGNLGSVDNLIDGLYSRDFNRYANLHIPSGESHIVDLGELRAIHTIQFQLYNGDNRYFQYHVEVSADGTNYTRVIDKTTGQHRGIQRETIDAVNTRYVKITGTFSSLNDYFHIVDELFIIGDIPTVPFVTQDIEIDAVAHGSTDWQGGLEVPLNAGLYYIEYQSGATSHWSSDGSNGGRSWDTEIRVTVPQTSRQYYFGRAHDKLDRFATAAQAEAARQGEAFFLYMPVEAPAYFRFNSGSPSDNRGSQIYKVTQVSGPNDSLIVRVRDAVTRSVAWQEREVAYWEDWMTSSDRRCFGCHVQTQASVGINLTKDKLVGIPLSKRLEDEFVSAYKQWQHSSGLVSPFHNDHRKTQTSLWAWAVSTFQGEAYEQVEENLLDGALWLRGQQSGNGGWTVDHTSNDARQLYDDGSPSAAHTSGNIQAFMRLVAELSEGTFEPFTSVAINGSDIALTDNEANSHSILTSTVNDVTAIRITINDSFSPDGNFVINELEAFNGPTKHSILASEANFEEDGFPIAESHDGDKGNINNGWGYAPEDVRVSPAVGYWFLDGAVTIDRLTLTQIFPDKQLKGYTVHYTVDPSPTTTSEFLPFPIVDVGEFDEGTSTTIGQLSQDVREAAALYSSGSWNFARNTRTASQTLVGLFNALPVLEGASSTDAFTKIGEVTQRLREAQNADGGWSDTTTSGSAASQPYQSAHAIYGMLLVLDQDLDEDLIRGVEYLLRTQRFSGSWSSPPGIDRDLAATTWVEIALPLIFERLNEQFQRDTITDVRAIGLLDSVEVSWSPVEEATGYNVYRRSVDGVFQRIATNHQDTTVTYLDDNVQNEATYIYMVRWLDSAGQESSDSNEASATPSGLVCGGDSPPSIVSTPVVEALEGNQYNYQVEAEDPDEGDVLTYSLDTAPVGMSIDSTTGLITWSPSISQLGSHFVRVWVEDSIGRFATQAYRITVAQVFFNREPVFVSTPITTGVAGYGYIYEAKAVDPNLGDILTYELVNAPAGMTINSTNGRIRWTPGSATDFEVEVMVTDAGGLTDTQTYTGSITENAPPSFTSSPITMAFRGLGYLYQAEAEDPEGGQVEYSLMPGAPSGMTVQRYTGLVLWTPPSGMSGGYPVTVVATDEGGLTAEQSYVVEVPANNAPAFRSTPITTVELGATYRYQAGAVDLESPIVTYSVLSGPEGMVIDSTGGLVTWTPQILDTASVVLQAEDSEGATAEQSFEITVLQSGTTGGGGPNPAPGIPTANVDSPTPGSTIDVVSDVFVSVVDPVPGDSYEVSWIAELRRDGEDQGIELGTGNGPVTNLNIGEIDPGVYANDSYRIWIYIDYGTSIYSYWFPYDINSRLKLGAYTTTVQDLQIPLTGVSIDITREYRSYDTAQYQFGHGWKLRYPGRVVDSASEAPFTPFTANQRVFVTLPDGRRVGFTFSPYAPSGLFPWLQVPYFAPDPGVFATLEVDESTITPTGGFFYEFLGGAFNPSRYYLTTQDRIRYTIVEGEGITEIRDANENTLTFNEDGIHHSSGESVQIERNGDGNISMVTIPGGGSIQYRYDANGDLVEIEDIDNDIWKHTYDDNHRLKTIIDPDGVTLITNFYDANGRLFKQIDANGNEIEIDVDIDNNIETISDRRGNPTRYEYDNEGNLTQIVDPLGGERTFEYDSNYNITSIEDQNGNTKSWSYDSFGRITSQTDGVGRVTSLIYNNIGLPTSITYGDGSVYSRSYDARGNLLSASDPSGRITTSTLDSQGRVASLTDPLGVSSHFNYDGSGRVIRTDNGNGLIQNLTYDESGNVTSIVVNRTDNDDVVHEMVTSFTYDNENRPISKTDASGATSHVVWSNLNKPLQFTDRRGYVFTFDYDGIGNLKQINYPDMTTERFDYDEDYNRDEYTDRNGNVTKFEYDELGRKTKVVYPGGDEEKYEYDGVGNRLTKEDARGNITQYRYDDAGRLVERESSLGAIYRDIFDEFDNIIESTDPLGQITTFTFDSGSRLIQEMLPDSALITNTYNLNGQRVSMTDPLGRVVRFEYDDAGRNTKKIDELNNETTQDFDEVGNLLQLKDPSGNITKYDYDNRGRLIHQEDPTGETQSWDYDENGNLITYTDTAGKITRHEYDFNNRRVKTVDPELGETIISYDAVGNRTSLLDPEGNVTQFRYDNRNRLREREDSFGFITHHEYDEVGNLIKVIDRNGRVKKYQYDNENRKSLEQWLSDDTPGAIVLREKSYEYDLLGNVTRASDGLSSYSYTYDENSALTEIDTAGSSELPEFIITRDYDLNGNLVSVLDDLGSEVRSVYNERGELVSRSLLDSNLEDSRFDFSIDDAGRVTGMEAFLSTDQSIPWLKSTSPVDGSDRVQERAYALPDDSSILSEIYDFNSAGQLEEIDRDGELSQFTYDDLGQIDTASYTSYPDENFTYDSAGNRADSGIVVGAGNRITEDSTFTYDYDNEGSIIRRTYKSDGNYEEFNYNHDNQVEEIVRYDAADNILKTIEYRYDVFGRRIGRIVDGVEEIFTYDGEDIWSDFAPAGDKTRQYLYDQGIDNPLAVHDEVSGRKAFLKGNHSSILGTLDDSGSLASTTHYSAFGRTLNQTGAPSRYRYTAREFEPELDLYFNRARIFDPNLGRFLSEDPIGFNAGDYNIYRYSSNAPTHFRDPSGKTTAVNFGNLLAVSAAFIALSTTQTYNDEIVSGIAGAINAAGDLREVIDFAIAQYYFRAYGSFTGPGIGLTKAITVTSFGLPAITLQLYGGGENVEVEELPDGGQRWSTNHQFNPDPAEVATVLLGAEMLRRNRSCPWKKPAILSTERWKHVCQRHVPRCPYGSDDRPNDQGIPPDKFPRGTSRDDIFSGANGMYLPTNLCPSSDRCDTVLVFEGYIRAGGKRVWARSVINRITGSIRTSFPPVRSGSCFTGGG